MLIHPLDAALDTAERKDWLAATDRFGMLVVASAGRPRSCSPLSSGALIRSDAADSLSR